MAEGTGPDFESDTEDNTASSMILFVSGCGFVGFIENWGVSKTEFSVFPGFPPVSASKSDSK